MGLKTMSLLAGATVSATGGTALVFAEDGVTIANGVHLIVPADADYRTRRSVTAKVKQPTFDAKTGKYGKDRKTQSFTQPIILADGTVAFNVIRVEREVHPETSASAAAELNLIGAQLLVDSDESAFWATGALS